MNRMNTILCQSELGILDDLYDNSDFLKIEASLIEQQKNKLIKFKSIYGQNHVLILNQYHIFDEDIVISNINTIVKYITKLYAKIEENNKKYKCFLQNIILKQQFITLYVNKFQSICLLYSQLETLGLYKIKSFFNNLNKYNYPYYQCLYNYNNYYYKLYISYKTELKI